MKKLNLQGAFKHFIVATLSIMMVFSAIPMNAFAATNDKIIFEQDPSSYSEHNVLLDGDPWTLYCMQYDYLWPRYRGQEGTSEFTVATDTNYLMNDEQKEIMRRALYAGYPHNGAGFLDNRLTEAGITDEVYFEYEAIRLTSAAIWALAADMGIPGNTKVSGSMKDLNEGYEKDIVYEIINFAKAKEPALKEKPTSDKITFKGDSTFKEQEDGTWLAGPLTLEDPDDYNLWHELSAPDGIQVMDENGWEFWGGVFAGQEFYLSCDDPSAFENGVKINATAKATYPGEVTHFMTQSTYLGVKTDKADESWKVQDGSGMNRYSYPIQTMLGVKATDYDLSGSMDLDFGKTETSSLTIEKEIVSEHAKAAAEGKAFSFSVELKGDDKFKLPGKEYTLEVADISEEGEISNVKKKTVTADDKGNLEIEIKAGQEAVIEGIPCGVEYTVKENVPTSDAGTWTPDKNNVSGTISLDDLNRVEITNDYAYEAVGEAAFTATKRLEGTGAPAIKDGQFKFVLVPKNEGNPMPEGTKKDEHGWPYAVVSNDDQGKINFGEFNFNEPGTYVYTVQEEDVTASNTSRDQSEYVLTFDVKASTGALTVNQSLTKNGEDVGDDDFVFVNKYTQGEVTQDFSAVKRIEDMTGGGGSLSLAGYKFEITPATDETAAIAPRFKDTGLFSYTMTSDEAGIANSPVLEFTETWFDSNKSKAKDGQIVLEYKIKELDNSVSGVTNDNDAERNAKVTVTKKTAGDGSVEMTSEVQYQDKNDWSNEEPEFVNTYAATAAKATVKVDKKFNVDYKPSAGEEYKFIVTPAENYGDDVSVSDVVLKADGNDGWSAEGGALTFNKAGIYEFKITESDPEIEGMECDSKVWGVRVHVTDDGSGELKVVSVVYSQEDTLESTDKATFTNKYDISVNTEFDINKKLIGADWRKDEAFHFNVDGAYFAEDPESFDVTQAAATADHAKWHNHVSVGDPVDNEAKATVKATMDKAGVYYFVVDEVSSDYVVSDSISYDDSVYVAKVVVTREGNRLDAGTPELFVVKDGKLEKASEISFTNYESRLAITKKVVDPAEVINKDQEYNLLITIHTDDERDYTDHEVYINGEKEFIEFVDGQYMLAVKADDEIVIEGLPLDTKYTVEEALSNAEKKVFETTVTVNKGTGNEPDTNKGTKASAVIGEKEQHEVTITNASALTNLVIEKKVVDKTGKIDVDSEIFDFEITAKYGPFDFFVDKSVEGEFDAVLTHDDGSKTAEKVSFANGVATVSVGHGESLEIKGLSAGAGYQVVEKNPGKYKTEAKVTKEELESDGKTAPVEKKFNGTKAKGELSAGMIDTVSFVNTLNDDSDKNGGDKDKDKNHGGVDTSDHAPLKPMIFLSITSLLGIIFMLFRRRIAK